MNTPLLYELVDNFPLVWLVVAGLFFLSAIMPRKDKR